ncbi:hypothetical protein GJAV_G00204980 [Gymnothorax javanicus]|nr:hypothetical protein GJAV_G00204980 [Gymnothorax javanicus]
MALLCYNKGCGSRFDEPNNSDVVFVEYHQYYTEVKTQTPIPWVLRSSTTHGDCHASTDACLYHPGVPIFHDALKGWSCCKKRTTDFSEFLSIQLPANPGQMVLSADPWAATRGRHSNKKPQEPLCPEVTSNKAEVQSHGGPEIIYQGPKSAEALKKERPSPNEPMSRLPAKVSASLTQVLEKLEISNKEEAQKKGLSLYVLPQVFQGKETDAEPCIHHPGAPVFHECYKYWNCCHLKTLDFNAFLDQKGCTTGKHRWVPKQDRKTVACRHDWHQTNTQVVVTIYAKNSIPEHSYVETNRTVVVDVAQSSVSMVPSKVEVTLRKADPVAWGKLEDPRFKVETRLESGEDDGMGTEERPEWDISDDDISESDEEEDMQLPKLETNPLQ